MCHALVSGFGVHGFTLPDTLGSGSLLETGPGMPAACCALCKCCASRCPDAATLTLLRACRLHGCLGPLALDPPLAPQVKGRRLDTNGGIRTRARAREQAEQWHLVPAPARILALMADTLLEAREGAAPLWKPLGDSAVMCCIILALMADTLLESRQGAAPPWKLLRYRQLQHRRPRQRTLDGALAAARLASVPCYVWHLWPTCRWRRVGVRHPCARSLCSAVAICTARRHSVVGLW